MTFNDLSPLLFHNYFTLAITEVFGISLQVLQISLKMCKNRSLEIVCVFLKQLLSFCFVEGILIVCSGT